MTEGNTSKRQGTPSRGALRWPLAVWKPTELRESYRLLLIADGLVLFGGACLFAGLLGGTSDGQNSLILVGFGVLVGVLGLLGRRRFRPRFRVSTAEVIAGLASIWAVLLASGTAVYLLTGTFTRVDDALFESASGFSTVASTVADVDTLSTPLLLFRATTQWVGGLLGLFAAAVAIPATMKGTVQIPKGEGSRSNRLAPDIAVGRKRVLIIYSSLSGLCWIAYLASGLGLRSSTVHALTTVSTGGFSDRPDSLMSAPLASQLVATVFMVIAGCSYYVLFWLIRGNVSRFRRSPELRVYLSIIGAVTLWSLWHVDSLSVSDALFTAASASSTTGLAVVDWTGHNDAVLAVLLVAVATGAMSASAGSGLRVIRAWLLGLVTMRALRAQLEPSAVSVVRHRGRTVETEEIDSLTGYQFAHFGLFAIGAFILTLTGDGMIDALWTAVSMVSTFGLSPIMGPLGDATQLDWVGRMAMIPGMLAGRLSIFPLLLGFVAVLQIRRWMIRRVRMLLWRDA